MRLRNELKVRSTGGGPVDRSLRRLGQLLVVMGALLGAITGVAVALIVENAGTSSAVAALGREGAAVLAASPPSSQSPTSWAAGSEGPADGSDSSATQHAEAADRASQGDGKDDKNGEGRQGQTRPRQGQGQGQGQVIWTLSTQRHNTNDGHRRPSIRVGPKPSNEGVFH
jgi:hypothetical protein